MSAARHRSHSPDLVATLRAEIAGLKRDIAAVARQRDEHSVRASIAEKRERDLAREMDVIRERRRGAT